MSSNSLHEDEENAISNWHFEKFKRDFGEQLGKIGLTLSYVGLFGHDWKLKKGGFILARFHDNEGYLVTLILNRQYNTTTPTMGYTSKGSELYWSTAIWGMIVQSSTPFTLLFKEVNRGFMRGQAKVFLPFLQPVTSLPFNEKELLNSPLLQTKVVAALNSDKDICDNVAHLSLKYTVLLGSRTEMVKNPYYRPLKGGNRYVQSTSTDVLTLKASDIAGKCAIVPAGDETVVFLRNYGTYGDPEFILETMAGIRKTILANPHTEKVFGKIPDGAQWISAAYSLVKTEPQ